ncbi:MAG: hypothetical protein WC350_04390 [Candidatus Micrarchaeia archaeon]|jgi:hypothetical protein
MIEANGMKFKWIKGAFRRLSMRIAVRRAKKLMEKKCLGPDEKKKRDTLVARLGNSGNSKEHSLLKEWAVSGELHCRPGPIALAEAIAMGGEDEAHMKMLLGAITTGILCEAGCPEENATGRSVNMDEQYYFARLISAESNFLLQRMMCKNQGILALLEIRAARVAAFIEEQMPGMVETLKREMES